MAVGAADRARRGEPGHEATARAMTRCRSILIQAAHNGLMVSLEALRTHANQAGLAIAMARNESRKEGGTQAQRRQPRRRRSIRRPPKSSPQAVRTLRKRHWELERKLCTGAHDI